MALMKIFYGFYVAFMLVCMVNGFVEPSPYALKMGPTVMNGNGAFDVIKYGAVGDGKNENSKAFLAAWEAACSHAGRSSFVVPDGEFLLGPITFSGPCHQESSPEVVIKGIVKAIPDLVAFTDDSWIKFTDLHGLAVSGGGIIDGQGADAWNQSTCPKEKKCHFLPTSMKFTDITNALIHDIHMLNSKSFHISVFRSQGIQLYNLSIMAPGDSPNTDGIHISSSTNINITASIIGVGDDCVSIGDGSNGIFVSGVFCGPGHGISIGSLGKRAQEKSVTSVHVRNCTLSGTTNGVRIKTWPESPVLEASDIIFEDIIMDNVTKPIIIDQNYCPVLPCTKKPSRVQISHVTYKNIIGTSSRDLAISLDCSAAVPCQDIELIDIDLRYMDPTGKAFSCCSNMDKLTTSGVQNPPPCQNQCKES